MDCDQYFVVPICWNSGGKSKPTPGHICRCLRSWRSWSCLSWSDLLRWACLSLLLVEPRQGRASSSGERRSRWPGRRQNLKSLWCRSRLVAMTEPHLKVNPRRDAVAWREDVSPEYTNGDRKEKITKRWENSRASPHPSYFFVPFWILASTYLQDLKCF